MLESYPSVTVRQQVEPLQVFTGLEAKNRYRIIDPDGTDILFAYEDSGFMARQFLGNHRPLSIKVVDPQGAVQLTASRRFFWFLSHLELTGPAGAPAGRVDRRFKALGRRFDLSDGQGDSLEIHGPMLRPNTFWLRRNGEDVGKITKQWGGLGRELLTRADTFAVEFGPPEGAGRSAQPAMPSAKRPLSESMRWAVLAAAIAIDLDFFESPGRRGGMTFNFGPR
ncbi:MAG: hypothetical protein IIA54_04235 [Chloroflexi bacterium]|nr:hypothetical protein [Chloroflexota bacterium]